MRGKHVNEKCHTRQKLHSSRKCLALYKRFVTYFFDVHGSKSSLYVPRLWKFNRLLNIAPHDTQRQQRYKYEMLSELCNIYLTADIIS